MDDSVLHSTLEEISFQAKLKVVNIPVLDWSTFEISLNGYSRTNGSPSKEHLVMEGSVLHRSCTLLEREAALNCQQDTAFQGLWRLSTKPRNPRLHGPDAWGWV